MADLIADKILFTISTHLSIVGIKDVYPYQFFSRNFQPVV